MSIKFIVDGSALDYTVEKVTADVNGETIGECLNDLVHQQPSLQKSLLDEKGTIKQGNLISLNGYFIYGNDLTQKVKDGDEIGIRYFRGGC